MSQASFWRKQLNYLIWGAGGTKFQSRFFQSVAPYRFFLLSLAGIVTMILWNWKLVLATIAGVGSMVLIYLVQEWNWQVYWYHWRRFFTGSNGQLGIAVGSGGIGALSTYIAASIWADSENRWLATSRILQGFGTLIIILLLLWHILTIRANRNEYQFEELLQDLTAQEPLKRLIAVRQLTHLGSSSRLSQGDRHELLEYFRLMLSQEQEPVIREAVLDGLQTWEDAQLRS